MNEILFSKYEGCGNDFVLIDDRDKTFPIDSQKISRICHRNYGIGSDGLILLHPSTKGDFSMRIFNSDGSEAEMCGNGLRCFIQFLQDLGEEKKRFEIETLKKTYLCAWSSKGISVEMGVPTIVEEKGESFILDVGVPHFVTFVEDLKRFDQEAKEQFSLFGVNINYATIDGLGAIRMRTFERGVEKETFACGTGGTAVCMAAWKRFGMEGSIKVVFHSGEELDFQIKTEKKELQGITMSGKASYVFSGHFQLS